MNINGRRYYYWLEWGGDWGLWEKHEDDTRNQLFYLTRLCDGTWATYCRGNKEHEARLLGVYPTLEHAKAMCVIEVRL